MPVYVDELFTLPSRDSRAYFVGTRTGHRWCHMWWDGQGDPMELHRIANQLGLKLSWFQNKPGFPHYDLTPNKRARALGLGVTFIPLRGWLLLR